MATEILEEKIYDEELHHKLKELIELKKSDASTIAKGINKSPSTISLYLNKKYTGRIDSLEDSLRSYLKIFEENEKTTINSLKFVETTIAKRLYNAANMCQIKGKMGVCYGSPGIGKTTAILEYQNNTSGVILVDPFEQTSKRAVLKQIADQLRLNYHNSMSLDEFTSNVIKKLGKNKYLIIIDEAENLKVNIFKIIRKIHDKTKNNCGVLFVGTEALQELLLKVKNGFPYISSRIGYLEKLDSLKYDDVEKLVLQYFPNATKVLITTISKTCNQNARNIQNLLDIALDLTISNEIELNNDVIEAAKEKLLI